MSAPVRWLDSGGAPPGTEELLGSAVVPSIPTDVHTRLLARATELAATPSAGLATMLATKTGLAGVVGAVGLASALSLGAGADTDPPRPTVTPAVPALVQPVERPVAPPVPEPEPAISVEALPLERSKLVQQPPSVDALDQETELVGAIQRTLAAGDAQGALALARDHQRRFPEGQLGTTTRLLVSRALGKLGRAAAAKRQAALLLERDPASVHAEEARHIVDDDKR